MADTRTLADVRLEVRDLTATEGDDSITDAQLDRIIRRKLRYMWGRLAESNSRVLLKRTALSGQSPIALPSDFKDILSVYTQGYRIWPLLEPERSYVTQASVSNLTLEYVPTVPAFTDDADEIDFINGLDDYVVYGATEMALDREEQDTTKWALMAAQAEQRLLREGATRDRGRPKKVKDVRARHDRLHGYRFTNEDIRYQLEGNNLTVWSY
jgi:hypothetical protein